MRHLLTKICLSAIVLLGITVSSIIGFSTPAQAVGIETQPYFIKHIEKDRILSVSPNFRGDLTQTSLLPSLTEISENYHIRATKSVKAEKLNGKLVPGLIVYVEAKSLGESGGMVAAKP
ncbi:MAG: hypothetical protein AAFQ14_00025 [Cyanobacteria bacterium J06621_12]